MIKVNAGILVYRLHRVCWHVALKQVSFTSRVEQDQQTCNVVSGLVSTKTIPKGNIRLSSFFAVSDAVTCMKELSGLDNCPDLAYDEMPLKINDTSCLKGTNGSPRCFVAALGLCSNYVIFIFLH